MFESTFQVKFLGDQTDEHGRLHHCFEAEIRGMEYSTILFDLGESGYVIMCSKHFHQLPKELHDELVQTALQHLA